MSTELQKMTINPKLAEALLATDEGNRISRESKIDQFTRAMQQGRWKDNGETIKLDQDGRLIDGAHRLRAIIKSGTTQTFSMALNVDRRYRDTIDRGTTRKIADDLKMDGDKNCTLTAAVCVARATWERGGRSVASFASGKTVLSIEEVRDMLRDFPHIPHSVKHANRKGVSSVISASLVGFCHSLWYESSPEEADRFVDDLASGANMLPGDAVLALRNKLLRNKSSSRPTSYKRGELIAMLMTAWNNRIEGKDSQRIQRPKYAKKGTRKIKIPHKAASAATTPIIPEPVSDSTQGSEQEIAA